MSKVALIISFIGGIMIGAAGWWLWPQETEERSAAALMDVVMWGREPIGGPFALIDHTGSPRTDADFRGKLLLIYFGFTYCSDACPTDLQAIVSAVEQTGTAGRSGAATVHHRRSGEGHPGALKAYVALFHPRLVGLTGDPKHIRKVALAYKVYFAKTEPRNSSDPNFDHSGFVFLVDADGKYLGFFPPGTSADLMVEVMRPHLSASAKP